jgi:phosphoglycerate dehydrogenase-like enzyme
MTTVLALVALGEDSRQRYRAFFRDKFPIVGAAVVSHHAELAPHIAEADILMSFGKPLGPNADRLIAAAKRLRWIQCLGTGVDNIVDLPSLKREVLVTNMHAQHGPAMSEAALSFMLALGRDLPRTVRSNDRHAWERWPPNLLAGKTVGIFGVGTSAAELAPKCKAMGMTVVGITSTRRAVPGFDRMHLREELIAVVSELDYLVLLTPYSPATHRIIDAKVLGAMKPTGYLINIARGGIVDEAALIEALQQNRIAGAALDVFDQEPLPPEHPLWSCKNVILTPHQAGYDAEYDQRALAVIERNMSMFLSGDTKNMVNIVAR